MSYVLSLIVIWLIYDSYVKKKSILKKGTISSCEHALKEHGKWEKVASDVAACRRVVVSQTKPNTVSVPFFMKFPYI